MNSRDTNGRDLWACPAIVGVGCFALLALTRMRTLTSDSFMALVGGRWIAQRGLPTVDSLTVAGAGRSWIDEQWLAQWTLYQLWRSGGFALLATVSGILVASAFGLLTLIMLERGAHLRRAIKWATFAFVVSLPDIAIRAQDFAYVLFALVLWLILRDLNRPPSVLRAAILVSLLVVWANLHGSVLVGSALVCAHFARKAVSARGASAQSLVPAVYAFAAGAAPLATPYGLDITHYYDSVLGNSALAQFASEWQPAIADPLAASGFFALLLAVAYVLITGLRRGVRPWLPMLTVASALVLAGFLELRFETWAAFVLVILATDILNASQPAERGRPRRWVEIAVVPVAVVCVIPLATESPRQFQRLVPLGAINAVERYAAAYPAAPILADDATADALLWAQPSLAGRVGFDDRLEIYSQPALNTWANFIRDRKGAMIRATTAYDILIASDSNNHLANTIRILRGWRLLYSRRDGVVAVKT